MLHVTITSPANPHVKEALAVKKKRRKYGYRAFLIEGPHLIEMAVDSGAVIRKVFFTEHYSSAREGMRILNSLAKTGAGMFRISEGILSRMAGTETPQGIVAIASHSPHSIESMPLKDPPLLVVVDGIQDPGNLGTIIRTADAAGSDGVVVLPGTCDTFAPKVLRATSGSVFTIPIVYAEAEELTNWLRAKSLKLIATSLDAPDSLYEEDLTGPLAFVFGNEARGVSAGIRRQADSVVKIPLYGKAESLNVSIAAALCIFEAVRQRRLTRHK